MQMLVTDEPKRLLPTGARALLWRACVVALVVGLSWALAMADVRLVAALLALSVGAVAAIKTPWLAWAAAGAVLPFAASYKWGIVSLLDLLLIAALGIWFADGVRRRTLRLASCAPAVVGAIYLVALLAASIGARDLQQAIAEVIKWTQFVAVVLILPVVTPRTRVPWLVAGILVGASAQAGLGLYQFVFRIGPEWFVVLGRYMRASGSFAQPNPFAGYLGLVLPVAVSLAILALNDLLRSPGKWQAWAAMAFYAGSSGMIAAGLLASWSRGGWLAAALAGTVVVGLRSRRAALVLGAGAVVLGGLLLAGSLSPGIVPGPVAERLREIPAYFGSTEMLRQEVNDDNFAIIERLAHWEAAKRMYAMAPWLGVGPGNYAAVYADVRLPLWSEALGHAHNIYLNVLAESGLIGFAAFALLWIATAVWLVQRIAAMHRTQPLDAYGAALGIGVLGVLVHLAAHSMVDNLFVQGMVVQVALWLALVQAYTGVARDDQRTQSPIDGASSGDQRSGRDTCEPSR